MARVDYDRMAADYVEGRVTPLPVVDRLDLLVLRRSGRAG